MLGRVLYRIITDRDPNANLCPTLSEEAPRGPELADPSIHSGLSMFDTLEGAVAKIEVLERGGRRVYGLAEFVPGPGVTVRKTLGRGHYTVSGSPRALMASWARSYFRW